LLLGDKLLLLLGDKLLLRGELLLLLLLGGKLLELLLLGSQLLLSLGLLGSTLSLSLLSGKELLLLLLQGIKRLEGLGVLLLGDHLLLLSGNKLLLLLGYKLLLLLGNKLLLEVGREGINLTILVLVTGETFQSNLFSSQLRGGDQGRSTRLGLESRSKLLLLLGYNLLLLLLGVELESGLLLLGDKSLLLSELFLLGLESGGKLLLLLGDELLLLLSGDKLLLLSWGKLLLLLLTGKLLLLGESVEILVEALLVKLVADGGVGVEVGSIEDRSSLTIVPLVGEGLSLEVTLVLSLDRLLLLNNSFLMIEDSLMSCSLLDKSRILYYAVGALFRIKDWKFRKSVVGSESCAVVAGVFYNLNLSMLVQESISTFNISLDVSGLHLECAISSLKSDCITSIFVDFIDVLDDDFFCDCFRSFCGGRSLSSSNCRSFSLLLWG